MKQSNILLNANQILNSQLRQKFTEEGQFNKNVTFSISEDVGQKIEEISKNNKLLEEKYSVSGLPTTKSDILANAIEVYYDSYFRSLSDLNVELESLDILESNLEKNIATPDIADTLIVAARVDGFESVFLKNHEWYEVRVAAWRLKNLKYLGVYVGSPVSQVTHYAKIKNFEILPNKKLKFKLDEPIKLDQPITLSSHDLIGLRQTVYTTLEQLKKSKYLYELSYWWHKNFQ